MADIDYGTLTIVVIDDQEFVRSIVSKMLVQMGVVNVITAAEGGAGFDAVVAHKPDLVICDIKMSPVDGLEFLRRLHQDPMAPYAQTPVIFMTGAMDPETMVKAQELGVNATVLKPVPPRRLREKIDALSTPKKAESTEMLPDAPPATPSPASSAQPSIPMIRASSEAAYADLKALVVDDQLFIRRIVVGFLRKMGFRQIEEAGDGVTAIKVNNAFIPNIILCDIEMEPMDGLTFLQILRTNKSMGNSNVPVIFLSNHADSETVKRAGKLGVNAFLVKPTSLEKLSERVNFVLFHQ
ncbi:MAG: response regulator [Alphaproteobacteria bacterium]|nr:response regulator [Alphaproteobacteria bacterium]